MHFGRSEILNFSLRFKISNGNYEKKYVKAGIAKK